MGLPRLKETLPEVNTKLRNHAWSIYMYYNILTDDIKLIGYSRDDFSLLFHNTLIGACVRWIEWSKCKSNITVREIDSVTCRQCFAILGPLNRSAWLCPSTLQGISDFCRDGWRCGDGAHRNRIWWKEKKGLFWLISVRIAFSKEFALFIYGHCQCS